MGITPSLSRRDFIITSGAMTAAMALGGPRLAFGAPPRPTLVKLAGPGVPADIAAAVKRVLEPLGGMAAFVKPGQKVLLKPNIGFATPPEQRATTSPAIVAAVAKLVLAAGAAKVLVMDNPTHRPEACTRVVGIKEALTGLDVVYALPTAAERYLEREIPTGQSLRRTRILRDALECDVHIALPIAKSHNAAGFTGTLKGMMGLILDRESFHGRLDLNQAVVDLNTVLKPHLTIMDGLQVMASDGPAGPGELVTCNALLAGTDAVAVDAAAVGLAPLYGRKLKPSQVKHLRLAEEQGLGRLAPPPEQVVTLAA